MEAQRSLYGPNNPETREPCWRHHGTQLRVILRATGEKKKERMNEWKNKKQTNLLQRTRTEDPERNTQLQPPHLWQTFKTHIEEKIVPSADGVEKTGDPRAEDENRSYRPLHKTQNGSKAWRCTGESGHCFLTQAKTFWKGLQWPWHHSKFDTWCFTRLKRSCTEKETIARMKTRLAEWGESCRSSKREINIETIYKTQKLSTKHQIVQSTRGKRIGQRILLTAIT